MGARLGHRREFAVALVVCLAVPIAAHAQRGANYSSHEPPLEGLTTGFPGFFDTTVAGSGSIVTDLPFLNLNVGVTPNLSVGTNLFAWLPNVGGVPSGYLTGRYRYYSKGGLVSVLSGYGGGLALASGNGRGRLWLGLLTSNTSYQLTRVTTVSVQVLGAQLRASDEQRDEQRGITLWSRSDATAFGLAAALRHAFGRHLGIQLAVLSIPLVSGRVDTSLASADASSGAAGLHKRVLGRTAAEIRLGRNWLITAGVLLAAAAPDTPLPWLSVSWSWKL